MPRSNAWRTAFTCSSYGALTVGTAFLPQPNPISETRTPVFPIVRYCMFPSIDFAKSSIATLRLIPYQSDPAGSPPVVNSEAPLTDTGRCRQARISYDYAGPLLNPLACRR